MDILSAKLRVPGGCDLLFFKFSSCGEWIFSSNSSNWADLNSSFPDVCGENEKNALFQREKQGKLPSKLYTKFRASVCWLSQSHQRGALFQFQIQKGRYCPSYVYQPEQSGLPRLIFLQEDLDMDIKLTWGKQCGSEL